MGRQTYHDFELKFEREEKHYIAKVLRSPAGEAQSTFTLPFSEDRLELLILKLGRRFRHDTRRIHSEEMEAARELGGNLFKAVFHGEVLGCLRSSLNSIYTQEGVGLRLKLRLQDVPELADIPWEFLFDQTTDSFLAQSNMTPIVRYIEMPQPIRPLIISLPLQVLVMVSSPTDYISLDIDHEKTVLEKAFEPLKKKGKVKIVWLERATLRALQRCLRGDKFHIFHFIGHGGVIKNKEEGSIILEDSSRRSIIVGGHKIGALLHDHQSLRLVVLNSCEGARNSRADAFSGVAATLIQQGIPAVLAMQFEITDRAAIILAEEFYTSIVEGLPVDAAVAEARKAIYFQPNDLEWGTPVIYMRSNDGILFDPMKEPTIDDFQMSKIRTKPQALGEKEESLLQKPVFVAPFKVRRISHFYRLEGHKHEVNSVCFAPDGKTLASGSTDDTIRIWNIIDGKLIKTLKHNRTVLSVSFSPDGTLLASGSNDHNIQLWRISDERLLKTFEGHKKPVRSLAFSPDGKILASGSEDNDVNLWRISDGKLLNVLEGHKDWVYSIVFSKDGKILASAGDKRVFIWLISDKKILHKLVGHEDTVRSVSLSPDSKTLASSSGGLGWNSDNTVRLWSISDGELILTLKGHAGMVNSVAFSPDGVTLSSGADDYTVRLWRASDGMLLAKLEGHEGPVESVAYSPDGKMLATASSDHSVRLWKIK